MILSIPMKDLMDSYRHVEPHLVTNHLSLKEFMAISIGVLDKVEEADPRSYCSDPHYYLDYTTPLAEFDQKIQEANPTNCYEDLDAAFVQHQLTALALEVYYELVNSLRVYKIVDLPMVDRVVVGWQDQNMLIRVRRKC